MTILSILSLLLFTQCVIVTVVEAAPTETPVANDRLEQEAREETERILNTYFRAQIEYFTKVKQHLGAQTKRSQDIDAYVSRLNDAIVVQGSEKKSEMWLEIFQDFNKSPLLLNKQSETGLTNLEYENILKDSGIQDVAKNFLADVAAYFWKMAKVSGKVMEVAIDDYIKDKRVTLMNLIKSSRKFF